MAAFLICERAMAEQKWNLGVRFGKRSFREVDRFKDLYKSHKDLLFMDHLHVSEHGYQSGRSEPQSEKKNAHCAQ